MLEAYVPVLVFVTLGLGVGMAFTVANRVLGPRRSTTVKREPYECGLPSEVRRDFRFGVSYYMVGMLFILFDLEVVLLYPAAIVMGDSPFALGAIGLFIALLFVAFVYEWRNGSLDWRE